MTKTIVLKILMYNNINKFLGCVMNDFKLKLVLSLLGGVVFSFIFILLAFSLPLQKEEGILKPKSQLDAISKAVQERLER
jgi:hypothetical protein